MSDCFVGVPVWLLPTLWCIVLDFVMLVVMNRFYYCSFIASAINGDYLIFRWLIMDLADLANNFNLNTICRLCMGKGLNFVPLFVQDNSLSNKIMAIVPVLKVIVHLFNNNNRTWIVDLSIMSNYLNEKTRNISSQPIIGYYFSFVLL